MVEGRFTNDQLAVEDLPSISTLNWQKLHKDYLTSKIMGSILFSILLTAGVFFALFVSSEEVPTFVKYIGFAFLLFVLVCRFLTVILGYRKKMYALRERDIAFKTGILWKSSTVIPFNRIQHAEVNQSPLERLFDLSELRIFTAGGTSSDMTIPGLRPTDAHRMKEFVLRKTASHDEEE